MSTRSKRAKKGVFSASKALALLPSVFALGVAALSGGLGWSMAVPEAKTLVSSSQVTVHESRADAALRAGPAGFAIAEQETKAGLDFAPATASGWLRLAYLSYARSGSADAEVQQYIARSFDASPHGPDVTAWRLRFLLENWEGVTPGLRQRAVEELVTTARYRGARAREITQDIQNPAGRLAAAMATSVARSYDPRPIPALLTAAVAESPMGHSGQNPARGVQN